MGKDNVQCRLDRALANQAWLSSFSRSNLINLDREWSDHAPIKLRLQEPVEEHGSRERIFRFEQVWVDHEGCEC